MGIRVDYKGGYRGVGGDQRGCGCVQIEGLTERSYRFTEKVKWSKGVIVG